MTSGYQIPRNSLIWLLVSMFAGIAPHADRLPIWLTAVCLLCGGWRIMVYLSRWRLPSPWIKALLVFCGIAAVLGHYGTLLGPEAGTALLILGFCFKLLETHHRRDAFVVVVLGFFVVATAFFFQQSMVVTAYMLLVCFCIVAALIGLNQTPLQTHPSRTARRALGLILQSLPLMVVLFIFVPRVSPLWSLDIGSGHGRTGLSESITPGDIANLSRSPKLAFRAEFDLQPPEPSQLYWRALVMDHYDGATWSWGSLDMDAEPFTVPVNSTASWDSQITKLGNEYNYRIVMEPTDQRWLFALAAASSNDNDLLRTRDFRLLANRVISQPFSYSVNSHLNYRLDTQLPRWLARLNTQLPDAGDPQSRQLARQLAEQSSSVEDLILRILNRFQQQGYVYTLRPPRLEGDQIDQFLFESLRGFCSHYAGAFVYLMRAAGVPARIVAGYQGGELNPLGDYILIHQFDAHAWAEVWVPGKGWLRVDPTAAIAPSRVEQGIEEALSEEQSFLEDSVFSPVRYRSIPWLSQLRLAMDYINFAWHRSVLGYDVQFQSQFLSKLLGEVNIHKLGVWMIAITGAVLALIALAMFWPGKRQSRDPMLALYLKFCRKMKKRDMARLSGESPLQYLRRLEQRWPDKQEIFAELTHLFQESYYGSGDTSEQDAERVKVLIRSL